MKYSTLRIQVMIYPSYMYLLVTNEVFLEMKLEKRKVTGHGKTSNIESYIYKPSSSRGYNMYIGNQRQEFEE
jgi:hypothetical protein